jgi:hypothetical protein
MPSRKIQIKIPAPGKLPRKKKNKARKSQGSTMVTVTAPAARSTKTVTKQAQMVTTANTLSVRHRELISLVSAANGGFPLQSFRINPGNTGLFPWLSNIAANYETYKFKGLRFLYVSQAPTTAPGSVRMVVDYDVLDASPNGVVQMSSMVGCVSSPLWAGTGGKLMHVSSASNLSKFKEYFVATTVPAGADAKTYDVGRMFLSIVSSSGAALPDIGELWVEYDVCFYTPQLQDTAGKVVSNTIVSAPTTVSSSAAFAPLATAISQVNSINDFASPGTVRNFKTLQHTAGIVNNLGNLFNVYQPSNLPPNVGTFVNALAAFGGTTSLSIDGSPSLFTMYLYPCILGYNGYNILTVVDDASALAPINTEVSSNGKMWNFQYLINPTDLQIALNPITGGPFDYSQLWWLPIVIGGQVGVVCNQLWLEFTSYEPAQLASLGDAITATHSAAVAEGATSGNFSLVITNEVSDGSNNFAGASIQFAGCQLKTRTGDKLTFNGFPAGYYYVYINSDDTDGTYTVTGDAGYVVSALSTVTNIGTAISIWSSVLSSGNDTNDLEFDVTGVAPGGTYTISMMSLPGIAP